MPENLFALDSVLVCKDGVCILLILVSPRIKVL